MYELIRFLASSPGRITSVGGGAALILLGLLVVQGAAGWVIAAVGLVPLGTGVLDVCILGPVAGLPFSGSEIRHNMR
jgi:hypothetical protein